MAPRYETCSTRSSAAALPIEIVLVVSSKPQAAGLQFAGAVGIPTAVFERPSFPSPAAYSDAIFDACRAAGAALVVMGGFLKFVPIPDDFAHRVLNIHPALIPAFCGQGMYGHHVHEAALAYGVKVSGCTVHFVDNQYDHGPILLAAHVPVLDGDTPDTWRPGFSRPNAKPIRRRCGCWRLAG